MSSLLSKTFFSSEKKETPSHFSLEEIQRLKQGEIPQHIALIPDGNRRWARKNLLKAAGGYQFGAERVVDFIETLSQLGVHYLTIYLFSTENWRREKSEYTAYFKLVEQYLLAQKEKMIARNVRLHIIGDLAPFPKSTQQAIQSCLDATVNNTTFHLIIALNYGSRSEIIRATKKLAEKAKAGEIEIDAIDETLFSSHLDTDGIPDPDLLIRTSGEHRLSNFLLWQLCYTELYLPDVPWPEFDEQELYKALNAYQNRERRWGK